MALSARDLYFAVRVDDRATRPLRRISNEVRALRALGGGEVRSRQVALQQARITAQRAQNTRRLAAQEYLSVRSGSQRLAQEKRALSTIGQGLALQARRAGIEDSLTRNVNSQMRTRSQILTNEAKLANMNARIARGAPPVRGMTVQAGTIARAATLQQLAAARSEALRLMQAENDIGLKAGIASNAFSTQAVRVQELSAAEAELNARQQLLGNRFKTASDYARLQTQRVNEASAAIRTLPIERLQALSSVATSIGRGMRLVGLVGVAATGFAAVQAAKFQTQTALAATQARPASAGAPRTLQIGARLNDVILKQMQQFPASSQEMADALYQIFSGSKIQNIQKAGDLLKLFNKEAVAGQAPLDAIVQAGLTLGNVFPQYFRQPEVAANKFFAAVRFGRMNVEQFARSLPNVLPVAKLAGQSFTDVADAAAFLTRQTGAQFTSRDMQGLARLYQLIARPEIAAGLRKNGVEITTTSSGRMKPLLRIIDAIHAKFPQLKPGPDLLNFFKTVSAAGGAGTGSKGLQGTVQALRIFGYAITGLKDYHTVARQVNRDNDEFTRSFQTLSRTPGVRWQIFINQLKALSIIIGTAARPALVRLGGSLVNVIHWFEQLSPHTQHLIGYFGAFSAVALLVGGSILSIVGRLASLTLMLRLSRVGMAGLGGEAGAVSARFSIFLAAAVGLIYIFIRYPGVFHAVTNAVGGVNNALRLLGGIIAGITLARLANSMLGVGSAATVAAGEVGVLRAMLLSLPLSIPISIIITEVIFRKQLGKAVAKADKFLEHVPSVKQFNRAFGYDPGGFLQREQDRKIDKAAADNTKRLQQTLPKQAVFNAYSKQWGRMVSGLFVPVVSSLQDKINAEWRRVHGAFDPRQGSVTNLAKRSASIVAQQRRAARQGLPPLRDPADTAIRKTTIEVNRLKTAYADAERAAKAHPGSIAALTKASNLYAKLQDAIGKQSAAIQKKATDAQVREANKVARGQETAANKAARAQEAAAKKAASTQKQATDNLAQYQSQVLQTLTSKWQEFYQANQQAAGQLFQGPKFTGTFGFWGEIMGLPGAKIPGAVVLDDLKAQVAKFDRFRSDLQVLRQRGAPTGLVTALQGAGPEALPNIESLRNMSRKQLNEYIGVWKKEQKSILNATSADFKPVLNTWHKHGKEIMKAIQDGITSQDFTIARTIEKRILADLRGEKPPTGHGKHGTTNVTTVHNHPNLNVEVHGLDPQIRAEMRRAHYLLLQSMKKKR